MQLYPSRSVVTQQPIRPITAERDEYVGEADMLVLVTYDVNVETPKGRRRLRRVARICEDHGQRVQNSVFECLVEPAMWVALKDKLQREIDPDKDSLRFYFLGSNWKRRVEHVGAKETYDPEGPLIA